MPHGLLRAKKAIVFNTSNTFPEREHQVFDDPLETIWRNCIFRLCGIEEFYRKTYSVVVTSSLELRKAWLVDVSETVAAYFPGKEDRDLRKNVCSSSGMRLVDAEPTDIKRIEGQDRSPTGNEKAEKP